MTEENGNTSPMNGTSAPETDLPPGSKFEVEQSNLNDIRAETVTITKGGAKTVAAGQVTVFQGGIQDVQADTVSIRQGGVQQLSATEVVIRQGGVVQANANTMTLTQGGLVIAQTDSATLNSSSVGAVMAGGDATLDQSAARGVMVRGNVTVDQSGIGLLVAREANTKNSNIGFLIAGRVEGEVKPLFGSREAIIFGAVCGVVFSLLGWLRERFQRDD